MTTMMTMTTMTTTSRRRLLRAALAATVIFGSAPAPRAQSVSEVLGFLVTNQSVPTEDFERDRAAAQATSETISRALVARLATLPITTSSSSFVYRLNPALGTEERATTSFDPFFVERALTAGRRQASIGLTFQHLSFTALDGRNLLDGSLVTTANQFADETEPFDVDRLALNMDASIVTLHGTYGVTDRLEVGFAVPTVTLRLEGSRVNTYRGQAFTQGRASAVAVGLADIAARTKYLIWDEEGYQLAAAALVRLPTGREDDLLGSGSASLRLSAIGSVERPRGSAHLNAGFSVGGIGRELNYGSAAALAVTPRLTVSGELIGRWLDGGGPIVTSSAPHPRLAGVNTLRLLPGSAATNLISVVPGMKWNVGDTWVIAANATLPLTETGLTSPVTPFVGVDYTF
jgi:hypothetical protein